MRRALLSVGVFLASALLVAHDTWLIPSAVSVAPGTPVTLDMTSGMDFPAPETAVKPGRLARAQCRLAGKRTGISDRRVADKSLQLTFRPERPGIATVWAESKPRTLDLEPAEVKEYLEEIGAAETAGKDWEKSPAPRKWRETYTKHAKTFLRVGDPGADRSWSEPAGMELEIVPEMDPTSLKAGDELAVRLLLAGRPVRDLAVGFLAAGEKTGQLRKTDGAGRVSFRVERAGWWLLRATRISRSEKPGGVWTSHFATLTVAAGPR